MHIHHPLGHALNTLSQGYRPISSGRAKSETVAAGKNRFSETQSPLDTLEALQQWQSEEQDHQRHAVRWSLERMPLRIHVQAHPQFPQAEPYALQAFRQWEAASGGLIRITPEPLPAHADIVIQWQRETTRGRDYEVGHTHRQVQGQLIQRVTITLIEAPRIDAHLIPSKQALRLFSTLLHEAGHALGLEHSQHQGDVMHHRGWQHIFLSPNDSQRLNSLYATAVQWL